MPLDVQYGPAHEVLLEPGGTASRNRRTGSPASQLPALAGSRDSGQRLAVEARAPDGVIEAFRVADSPSFALGLQWHPEWQFEKNPFSRALFAAFGEASRGAQQVQGDLWQARFSNS